MRLTPTADGLTHWSNWITWNVSTTATTEPFVSTVCKRGGTVIANTSAGYFASYPWPEAQSFSLRARSGRAAPPTVSARCIPRRRSWQP